VVHGEQQASGALSLADLLLGAVVARPGEAKGCDQRGDSRRRDAARDGLRGHRVLGALQVVVGEDQRGEELVRGHLDELHLVLGWPRLVEQLVQVAGIRDQTPVNDGRRRRFVFGGVRCPIVEEVSGPGAVTGGVVHGHADGEASAATPGGRQYRGLYGEDATALRQRRQERRDRGHLHGVVGGEGVDFDVVLGDGESDAVAGAVVELVPVGRAVGEPDAAGERVERADGV
jgi:hypothetical protein